MFPRMHVSLYVQNLRATVQFYAAFFGTEAVKVRPGYAKWVLESPSLIISFIENPNKVHPQFGHLGFQVDSPAALQERLQSAQAAGLSIREEMGTSCCFAVQDKFWVRDPDGYQWEVYLFHHDAEFNDPHYRSEDASACCMPSNPSSPASKTPANPSTCTPQTGCCG
jgi:catechol 2,3-dioxygenase-like lactoylglutathione lyase family enzyme